MLILDLWGISFHDVVVFGLGKNLLFKSILGRCVVVVLYGGHAPLLLLLAPHSIGRYESIASPTGAVKLLCSSPFFSLKQRLDDDMTD